MAKPSITTLRLVPLLGDLSPEQLTSLVDTCTWRSCKAGTVILKQNQHSPHVCFIVAGFMKIVRGGKTDSQGAAAASDRREKLREEVMVAMLGPGDMFGETDALLDIPRKATAIALTPCELLLIPRAEFLGLMEQNSKLAIKVSGNLARRLRYATEQIELMRGGMEGRIHALLRHCRQLGLDVDRWLSNAEIARMIGGTRVGVSKIVNRLNKASSQLAFARKKAASVN